MKKAIKLIKKAKTIALFSHSSPDPDTIGSTIALYLALQKMGKTVYDMYKNGEDVGKVFSKECKKIDKYKYYFEGKPLYDIYKVSNYQWISDNPLKMNLDMDSKFLQM